MLILDVGANVDCRPKFLEQFAVMGAVYSRAVLGSADPQVGLLNIGEEPSKGNDLALQVYSRLEKNTAISFAGMQKAETSCPVTLMSLFVMVLSVMWF